MGPSLVAVALALAASTATTLPDTERRAAEQGDEADKVRMVNGRAPLAAYLGVRQTLRRGTGDLRTLYPGSPRLPDSMTSSRSKAMAKPRKPNTAKKAAADGHAAIEDWIERWPWKKGSAGGVNEEMRPIVRQVDELVRGTIPGLQYAIKWRVPFYALPEQGWIIAMDASTSHVTVSFFGGADFDPPPPHDPGTPSVERARYVRVRTSEEAQGPMMRKWIEQAGRVRGWVMRVHEAKMRPPRRSN